MKKITISVLSGVLVCSFSAPAAHAKLIPDLHSYFVEKIAQVEASSQEASAQEPWMVWESVNVAIIPTVTFGLNDVASISISPEIDFVFTPEEDEASE